MQRCIKLILSTHDFIVSPKQLYFFVYISFQIFFLFMGIYALYFPLQKRDYIAHV